MTTTAVWAQSPNQGRVDLSLLSDAIGTTPKVNINFGPAMMAGFAETFRGQNAELAQVLGSVAGLRLMVFEDVNLAPVADRISDITRQLDQSGWNRTVEVRDDESRVDVFMLETNEFVKGLVLLVQDDGDTAVFANIHGDLDPVFIGRLIGSGNLMNGVDFEALTRQFQGAAEDG
ncbi:MAG: DUF4252 domain-containing protein [Wenzhouxiangellaceae bacterium]